MTIPIVVGVTGHRRIRMEEETKLRLAVKSYLQGLKKSYPHSSILLLTGLAEGADTLCAEEATKLGIEYIAVLPAEKDIFLSDFKGKAKEHFLSMYAKAASVVVAPSVEELPNDNIRDHRFRQVGIYIVEHSHILLALWDGCMPKPGGCGTAEVVDMLQRGSYIPSENIALRSIENECLVHVFTPREGNVSEQAGVVQKSGNEDILKDTEQFNLLSCEKNKNGHSLFNSADTLGETESKLNELYQTASGLSGDYAKMYHRIIKMLASASTLIAASFLLYDEMMLSWMILVCGVILVLAWLCRNWAVRSDCHRHYIEFRELAEALRVQAYLRFAGSRLDVKDVFPNALQDKTPWVFAAVCAIAIYPANGGKYSILTNWAVGQRDYHLNAAVRTQNDARKNERLVNMATAVSVGLYIVAVLYEIIVNGLFSAPLNFAGVGIWRLVIKVLLGSVSVGTVFLSNYYGKLSLTQKLADHQRMACFYGKMTEQIQWRGQNEELLKAMAREELVENSNWYAYQSENTPTLNL